MKLLTKDQDKAKLERLEPLGNIVLVRKLAGPTHERGIALPNTVQKNAPYPRGVVVASGPGRMLECGQWAPTGVKAGDKIVYNGPEGDMKLNGEELTVIDSSMVLAVVTEEAG